MEKIDQLLHPTWIIPCEPDRKILEHHSLAIKAGKIHAILPRKKAIKLYQAKKEIDLNNHALLPGFINSHTHIAMNIFRGIADDLDLMTWLNKHVWPVEKKWVDQKMVYDGSVLAMAEMIRGGTTCFNDMYFFPEETARAAESAGLRAHIGMTIINFPTRWAKDVADYFAKGMAFFKAYQDHELIHPTLAPQGVYTVLEKDLEKVKQLSDQYNLKVNIHVQESQGDIASSLAFNHKRPLRCLNDVGLVSPKLIAIHMTQLDEEDLIILKEKKPNIVHCPESNMKLSSGFCRVHDLMNLGVNVALGTDGAASNNDLDMIGEMRSAAFLSKIYNQNPERLSAWETLEMATINGARALGIDEVTGSLKAGKSADLIAIDLKQIETQPLYHPVSQIVYAASRNQVTHVWVAGKPLLKNRKLLTLNEAEILKKAHQWQQKIKK